MQVHRIIFAVLSWLTLLGRPLSADPSYYFKQLSLEEGLSQSTVKCVFADHKGMIWIGTHFGLNRFDREQIKSYYAEAANAGSLPDNNIDFIAEDSRKNLWIGTVRGLALYDRQKDGFVTQYHDGTRVEAYACLETKRGMLFFGINGFYLYEYASGRLISQPVHEPQQQTIPANKAHFVDAEQQTALLTCRWRGAWWYHPESGKAERIAFIPDREIPASFVDSQGQLWVSVYGKGVFCYTREGRLVRHLSTANLLTNDIVLDINEKEGDIWLATDGGGINIYHPATHTLRTIGHNPGNPYSCPVNSFYTLYNDSENNIWAGSIRGGLIGIKEVYIKTYKDAILHSAHGLSNKTVVGMHQDADGIIWLGTDGGGINRFDPATEQFRHYPSTYPSKVVSIIEHGEKPDQLIVSLFGEGFYSFSKTTGALREMPLKDRKKHASMFRTGNSVLLLPLDRHHIGLLADSLYIYELPTGRMECIGVDERAVFFHSMKWVSSSQQSSILMNNRAILAFDHQEKSLKPLYRTDNTFAGVITSVAPDTTGCFWIGTTIGLYHFNPSSGEQRKIESAHFHGITSLGLDASNRLWIGTHNALYTYTPATGKFVLFGESDGVAANEYTDRPPLIAQTGDIYMAGVMGLVRISHQIPFPENPDPAISLVNLILDGAPWQREAAVADHTFAVPWNHTSVTFQVIVKENDLMRKKLFRYYMQGERKEMVESYDHFISFHTLPVGEYTLFVSCNKNNGDWSIPLPVATLIVQPPWWQTVVFRMVVALVVVAAVAATILLLIKRNENKVRWAIQEHERKINEEKVRYLIHISHELRTPLTLIYAPLKRMLSSGEVKEQELFHRLSDIFRQTRRIKNIINMVLDVRKMEVGGDTLNIQSQEMNSWVTAVADDFANECDVRHIRLAYALDPAVGEVPFDSFKCEVVLSNLLMNALKFSKPHTTITVSTRLTGAYVEVAVADQGIGLGLVDPTQLFQCFYQGCRGQQGSGIGLSYSQLLIELHGGTIDALENAQGGATFFYRLPLKSRAGAIVARPYLNELLKLPEADNTSASYDETTHTYAILLVEDEPELRRYLKKALAPSFRHVYVAADGQEGLEMVLRYLPDIVVSDVMMPRMDGIELCRQIKANSEISHIPVVLLTARTDTESSKTAYKQGADAYLSKPFDLDFLQSVIQSQLQNRIRIKKQYAEKPALVVVQEEMISLADEKFMQSLNRLIGHKMGDTTLDVTFVAEQMAMSRATLYNKVKALTGISIGEYIQKARLIRAAELLGNKDLTILEISERVGFSSQRYFSTAFKQLYHATPTQYRQNNLHPPKENPIE